MEPRTDRVSIPVNFIYRGVKAWEDVIADRDGRVDLAELAPRIRFGREIWIVQAFLAMRSRGLQVTLGDEPRHDSINIVHADDLTRVPEPWKHFLVVIRADRDPTFVAQTEIVQNRGCIWSERDIFIPHWPQPGLIPRLVERRGRLRTLVYMGHPWNLASEFHDPAFSEALDGMGLKLEIREENWWDYRECDVVLAVRKGAPFSLAIKPASKLVNAWLAGCPAVLSQERGYSELRESPLDFFEAANARDVMRALEHLLNDPTLERRMVRHGTARAAEFSWNAVADRWERAILGPIGDRFESWRRRAVPTGMRRASHALRTVRRRVWGYQMIQAPPSTLRSWANTVRRAATLPPAIRVPR